MNLKTPCPLCKKVTPWEGNPYRPFCSERCKLIDLGLWASDAYVVPGESVQKEKDEMDKEET